jgi:hypothetical protein
MILSYQLPEVVAYRKAALALHDVERNIASRRNSKNPIDAKIMPRLLDKRAQLDAALAPLKAKADAAEAAALAKHTAPAITQPAANVTTPISGDGLDIPDFLRRKA